ncbi:MAG: hypothetical protein FJ296_07945 [Planctomycetes bacterium]|nr:hypothetical protein [Planctomycetota bacterium]
MLDVSLAAGQDDGRWPGVPCLDPHDDLQLDELAGRLLERFARKHDVEAYAQFMRLTRARLLDIAGRVCTRLPRGGPPDALVEAVLRGLFNQPRLIPPADGSVLVAVRGLLELEARRGATRAA